MRTHDCDVYSTIESETCIVTQAELLSKRKMHTDVIVESCLRGQLMMQTVMCGLMWSVNLTLYFHWLLQLLTLALFFYVNFSSRYLGFFAVLIHYAKHLVLMAPMEAMQPLRTHVTPAICTWPGDASSLDQLVACTWKWVKFIWTSFCWSFTLMQLKKIGTECRNESVWFEDCTKSRFLLTFNMHNWYIHVPYCDSLCYFR